MASSSRRTVNPMDEVSQSIIEEWLDFDDDGFNDEPTEESSLPLQTDNLVAPEDWLTDTEDDCEESEHETESELSGDSSDEDVVTGEQSHYYYGKNRFKWSNQPPSRNIRTESHNIIRIPRTPAVSENVTLSPIECFHLIFDSEMLDIILMWTNKKLEQFRQKHPSEQYTFKDMNQIELKGFLAILLYSAAFKSGRESILSLFATDGTGRNTFRASMSKKRFLVLLIALRFDNFDDREARKQVDPACAITDLLDMFNKNSQHNYIPGANVTVDEMLVAFRGKCKFKMYIPSKPARYGIKVQCLADSSTYYVYNTYIYTGKGSDSYTLPEEDKKQPIPTQAVLRLCKPIYNTNRNVTTDNWYSSYELSVELKKKGLTTVGTLKKNKAFIPQVFLPNKTRPVDSSIFGFTKECTLVSFVPKKNKAVILYSTMHHDNKVNPETRKPEIIEYYNATKSGVDSVDQKCSVYSSSRRSTRWPMAVFFRILDMCAWNSYVIYNKQNIRKVTRLNYIKLLAKQMNENNLKSRLYNTRLPRELRNMISEIVKIPLPADPPIDDKLPRNERKYCYICPSRLKRKTAYICHQCVKPICLGCSKKVCVRCVDKAKD